MTSYIRSGTHLAFAPLRATHGFLSATYGLVARTSSEAKSMVQSSLTYLRRDRTAPAAALVGLGPLLLAVIKDQKTESALKELLQLLKDALNILQRDEVQQITTTVSESEWRTIATDMEVSAEFVSSCCVLCVSVHDCSPSHSSRPGPSPTW
jgi:hypothetical protein